ncbi:MAG: arsenite methyltransferase [Ktedonobacterales bacterium]
MTQVSEPKPEEITERVRERYAAAAQWVQTGAGVGSCCSGDPFGADLSTGNYSAEDAALLPEEAVLASLGCGNPTALIELREGETVLDLGSGGGIDVLLSARRVGSTGFAFGLDMTDEMLALAQENKAKAGVTNVAFLKGRIEEIPLAANAVDVVISNCVINLSADKGQVLREAFRVLKPGGRFAVSDVVADGAVPEGLRRNMEAWVGCLAGALEIEEYTRLLQAAGFEDVGVEITRRYTVEQAGLDTSTLPEGWEAGDGKLASAFVRATKPRGANDGDISGSSSTARTASTSTERQTLLPVVTSVSAVSQARQSGCCGSASGSTSCCGA